jgi:GNAT superfamily N-acetyltransferase
MPRVTELLYLERETRLSLSETILMGAHPGNPSREGDGAAKVEDPSGRLIVPSLVWQPFHMVREEEFRAMLQASYTSSLDMPELEGVRSLDDILEGHRATGRFVSDRWQLGQVPGEPQSAVILMLSEVPDRDVWEVVYLGLTPAARGRGLGRQAIAHAIELARPHASRLELAVDIRNRPATRLYNATGFAVFERRSVHLAVFPENA